MRYLKLWTMLAVVILGSFTVLSYYGIRIYRQAPPIPDRVVTQDGRVLFTKADLQDGQNTWQSIGGQEVGSIWGHGAYVAPDWNADWLHRESLFLLDRWARADHDQPFPALSPADQAGLKARLGEVMRANTYDPKTGDLVLPTDRAAAFDALSGYYAALFGDAEAFPQDVRAYSATWYSASASRRWAGSCSDWSRDGRSSLNPGRTGKPGTYPP